MKLVRFGAHGSAKPGMIDAQGAVRVLSAVVPDIDARTLSPAALARLREIDPAQLPAAPVAFLNAVLKCCAWLKPQSIATSVAVRRGSKRNSLARSRRRPYAKRRGVVGVSVRRETEKLMGKMVFERIARF